MIVPVSSISGESYIPVFRQFSKRTSWISSYSNRPAKLFQGVEQRLTITISRKEEVFHTYSSPFQHWYESERDRLFPTLCYSESLIWGITGFPIKSGHVVLNSIFAKLMKMDNRRLSALEMPGILGVWVHNGPTYWVRALPFEPTENTNSERSNHYRRIDTKTKNRAYLIASLLNSSLYYFFFKMVSNCRDLGTKEWANFPVGIIENELENELVLLGKKLEEVLIATASKRSRQYPSGYIEYYEYYPARAKSAIDKIDRALALHYGLSDEELDFIINYDIKYRMGISAGEEEGGDDRT